MSYVHLTLQERYVIYHLVLYRLSIRAIARRLHRSASTISRELRRPARRVGPTWHDRAHEQAVLRRQQPRHARRQSHKRLIRYVIHRLHRGWSPQLIAGRLVQDYPGNPSMRCSPEGVYRWIYRGARTGGALYPHLVRQHPKRRKQHKYGNPRGLIPGRLSIHERPVIIEQRQRFGDWEGDTLQRNREK